MIVGLLGRKVGMTQVYEPTGEVIPVTVLEAGPCYVLQLKTRERDGYEAVQLGFLDKPRRLASRAARGHVARLESKRQKRQAAAGIQPLPKANCEPKRFIREIRGPIDGLTVGQVLGVDIFKPTLADLSAMLQKLAAEENINTEQVGWRQALEKKAQKKYRETLKMIMSVDVTGVTKGRGTAGVMKRWGFRGQRASHGVKKVHRHPGSIGCNTDPHHVFKGHRMAGHMGAVQRTVRNLQVVRVDEDNNLILVRGAVPGPNGGFVVIRKTNKL